MTDSSRDDKIYVVSHVARDLLQTAAVFKTEKVVVWEYVSNGLQYSRPGVPPRVEVEIDSRRKKMSIVDNGRGMDWKGLQNFWTMHGENLDRLAGKGGRGRFGTGKSAAFGIADTLRITSVKNKRRSKVELCRSDVKQMKSGEPIPLRILEREAPTSAPNGTCVEIVEVQLRHLSVPSVVKYIERHLAHWPKDVEVVVNNQLCEYAEPAVAVERRERPTSEEQLLLGDVELVLKVAKAPLDEDQRGVSIFSHGVWHETTLAGSENREMSQYIFGEVDVPALEDYEGSIPAFDATRSLSLNRENPVVSTLVAFLGRTIEAVRRDLVAQERERRASEEAKKLARHAQEIARVLNEDFDAFDPDSPGCGRNTLAPETSQCPAQLRAIRVISCTPGRIYQVCLMRSYLGSAMGVLTAAMGQGRRMRHGSRREISRTKLRPEVGRDVVLYREEDSASNLPTWVRRTTEANTAKSNGLSTLTSTTRRLRRQDPGCRMKICPFDASPMR